MEVKKRLLGRLMAGVGSLWLLSFPGVLGNEAKVSESSSLGSESFLEREKAGEELWKGGEESFNLLTALSLCDDPEVVWRSRRILRWVDMEITPETPREVRDMVESYLVASNARERELIYNNLLERGAYIQLFRLPRHVTDEKVARNLAVRVAELAGQIAEEKILAGLDEEALAILEDAKVANTGAMRWISLVSALGLGEKYWSEMSRKEQIMFARWEGNVDLLDELVDSDHEVRLTLRLLDGEVVPYLEQKEKLANIIGIRARIGKAHLTGQEDGENVKQIVDQLLATLEEKGVEQSMDILTMLAQMGYVKETLPYFETANASSMFGYYHGAERIEEAFRVMGLKLGEPVPEEWIQDVIGKVEGRFDIDNEGVGRIFSVGDFYLNRGEEEEARRLFMALLEKMDQFGITEVKKFLSTLVGKTDYVDYTSYTGFPEFVIEVAQKREEKSFQPQSFLMDTFDSNKGVLQIYRFLKLWDPEMDEWERVRAVLAIFGRKVDFPREQELEIIAALEKQAKDRDSPEEWRTLSFIGNSRGNLALVEKATNALKENGAVREYDLVELASLYLAGDRFEEAATLLTKIVDNGEGRLNLLPRLVVCLECAGRKEEAEERRQFLEKLALGDGSWLVTLGAYWGLVGNWEKQHELYQRALLQLPSESSRWAGQVLNLGEVSYRARKWRQAAALKEVGVISGAILRIKGLARDPSSYIRERGCIDFARAMEAFEEGEMKLGAHYFDRMMERSAVESYFAEDVFAELRRAQLHEQAERLWEKMIPTYRRSLELFPKCANTYNTVAWGASRAACDLEEASKWVDIALEKSPGTSSYFDTKAEVFFAKGEREKALHWSQVACEYSQNVNDLALLRGQYRHFRDDPLPLGGLSEKERLPEFEEGGKEE